MTLPRSAAAGQDVGCLVSSDPPPDRRRARAPVSRPDQARSSAAGGHVRRGGAGRPSARRWCSASRPPPPGGRRRAAGRVQRRPGVRARAGDRRADRTWPAAPPTTGSATTSSARCAGWAWTPRCRTPVGAGGRPAVSGGAGGTRSARVRNVVALLPGTAPTGRVFLVAHYDSVQVGPGGNDDGAGTATILETARALTAGPRPRNDVVFVLTDAEEACLCGAAAFAAAAPAGAPTAAWCSTSRPAAAPARSSCSRRRRRNADAGRRLRPGRAAPGRHLVRGRGLPAAAQRHRLHRRSWTRASPGSTPPTSTARAVYHTPLDTPAAMDRASLQHHGDNALALAREFGRHRPGDAGRRRRRHLLPGARRRWSATRAG